MKSTTTTVKNDINRHIYSYFGESYSGKPVNDCLANLKDQLKSFDYMPTDYAKGVYMAEGGTFLVYTQDMEDFLNGLGINPDHKEYSEQQVFKQYCHLIGRQVAELVR
jgi:hypothetical protein